jgi:hypothetical protein
MGIAVSLSISVLILGTLQVTLEVKCFTVANGSVGVLGTPLVLTVGGCLNLYLE